MNKSYNEMFIFIIYYSSLLLEIINVTLCIYCRIPFILQSVFYDTGPRIPLLLLLKYP